MEEFVIQHPGAAYVGEECSCQSEGFFEVFLCAEFERTMHCQKEDKGSPNTIARLLSQLGTGWPHIGSLDEFRK